MNIPNDILNIAHRVRVSGRYAKEVPALLEGRIARAILAERQRCAACCHTALDPDHFIMGGPSFVARQIKALIEEGTQT